MAVILIRTLILYAVLLLTLRFLGKRQMGEMELSEFVVAALIADLAANPLQDIGVPLLNALVPMMALFCCEVLISGLAMKSIRLRALLFGRPSLLIREGKIDQKELRKNRLTVDELLQELRCQSVTDVSTVESAYLETNGRLSILLYPACEPPTAGMLGLETEKADCPLILVSDGHILTENLRRCGRGERWLRAEAKKRGLKTEDIFLLTLDGQGKIYCVGRDKDEA